MKETNKRRLTIGAAVLAGLGATLCCLGPLLFAVLGLGAFGAAGIFAAARPYLLVVVVLLLAFGFYRAYFCREQACAPGEACETKPAARFSRWGLWLASGLVLAFALSPYYAGYIASALAHRRVPAQPPSAAPQSQIQTNESGQRAYTERVTVRVEGMTCTACEAPVRSALQQTPGVRAADVSYKRGDARVEYDPKMTSVEQIKHAINSTGYKAK